MKHNVDNPFINPRILSYCPGILGLERGLKRAVGTIRTVAYVEIEAFIIENLLAGMEAGLVDAAPIWCNLKTFDAAPFRGCVDGIIGGYPCQPFSTAGERKGLEDPRHLYPYLEQHIDTIRPVWCFFENVSGHLSLGFPEVRESLSNMGYSVEAGIFTAEEVGAPHERERLFILAIRRDYLVNSKSTGKRGEQRDIHQEDGRPDRGLQQQLVSPSDERLADTTFNIGETGGERAGREEGPNIDRRRSWSELADADINAAGGQPGSISSESGTPEGTAQGEDGQRCRDELRNGNEGMGDTSRQLIQRSMCGCGEEQTGRSGKPVVTVGLADSDNARCEEQRLPISAGPEQPTPEYLCTDRWPARPGEEQFDWEESRIESRLGFSIDGYNYREDLLRALGNSVVEQTAGLAFRTLYQKHFK